MTPHNPQPIADFNRIGPKLKGSNPGGRYERCGVQFYVKGSRQIDRYSQERAQNEVLASHLIKAAGAGAADTQLITGLSVDMGGPTGIASRLIQGTPICPYDNQAVEAVQRDFAVHAWLANHDVLSPTHSNTIIVDGRAVNIDAGGALLFRAKGQLKYPGLEFGLMPFDVPEWFTMRDPRHQMAGFRFYGSMSSDDLSRSARKVIAVSDETITGLVELHGPGDATARFNLATSLIARRDAMVG